MLRRAFSLWQMVWVPGVRLTPSTSALPLGHKSGISSLHGKLCGILPGGPWAGSVFLFCFDVIPRVKCTRGHVMAALPRAPLSDGTKGLPRGKANRKVRGAEASVQVSCDRCGGRNLSPSARHPSLISHLISHRPAQALLLREKSMNRFLSV